MNVLKKQEILVFDLGPYANGVKQGRKTLVMAREGLKQVKKFKKQYPEQNYYWDKIIQDYERIIAARAG